MDKNTNKLDKFYPVDKNVHPKSLSPDYKSTILRSPKNDLLSIDTVTSDLSGQIVEDDLGSHDNDLTKNYCKKNEPLGERIIVYGRLLDENERPISNSLIEIWQANSSGRYRHHKDNYKAPLDPNFGGWGRCLTDEYGNYFFKTIKPGAYPWPNGGNNWRPAHIHFSIYGRSFVDRLVTQMYFEGDPLFKYDPIFNSVPDKKAQDRLIAKFSIEETIPEFAHAYIFNIILRGRNATPMEI